MIFKQDVLVIILSVIVQNRALKRLDPSVGHLEGKSSDTLRADTHAGVIAVFFKC